MDARASKVHGRRRRKGKHTAHGGEKVRHNGLVRRRLRVRPAEAGFAFEELARKILWYAVAGVVEEADGVRVWAWRLKDV